MICCRAARWCGLRSIKRLNHVVNCGNTFRLRQILLAGSHIRFKLRLVFVRLGKCLVIAALVLATGAHWAALQTVAWTTMLASNLHGESFSEAVTKTFDGRHPCCLCKAIAAAKKSEKKSAANAPASKMEFPLLKQDLVCFARPAFETAAPADTFAAGLVQKPPTPPPRSCFI